jgi:DNA gyrase/topoisomerase IV subunit A
MLASDAFEGRAPASAGEEKTVAYLEREFRALGLKPGNPDGTYIQKVPMVGITSKTKSTFTAGGSEVSFTPITEYTRHGRGTKGMIAIQTSERNGRVVAAALVAPEHEIMLITTGGVLAPYAARSARRQAMPSIIGMCRSSRISPGISWRTASSAAWPSPTSRTA